jgi:uncharacterized protein (UPF0333 family)
MIKNKRAQATVEYLLLLAVIVFILLKVINHARDIFYGWGNQYGAVELFIGEQVVDNLSTNVGGWY